MIGKTISHYKILEKLGEGGMGVVYKAEDIKLKRPVALKFLNDIYLKNNIGKFVGAHNHVPLHGNVPLQTEAQAAAAVNHPNVCTIYEIDEADGQVFITMEYVEGESLRDKIKDQRLKIKDVIVYATQIAEGLQAIHDQDLVHRDIKSENILITDKGQVKIMDFGLVKSMHVKDKLTDESSGGTIATMSPEQIRGEAIDHRSDIWSFGVVLYEMLTRCLPFTEENTYALIDSILNEAPVPVENHCPDLLPEFSLLIKRMMEKKPENRYQSMKDLLKDLRQVQAERSQKETAPLVFSKFVRIFRRPVIMIPVTVMLVMIISLTIFIINRNKKIRWAKVEAIPKIAQLADEGRIHEAFNLVVEAGKIIPNDPKLIELLPSISRPITIDTDPQDAEIFWKEYAETEDPWIYLGKTLIDSIRLPTGLKRMKIDKEGFQTITLAPHIQHQPDPEENRKPLHLSMIKLDQLGSIPDGMVRVYPIHISKEWYEYGEIEYPSFFLDQLEVTNKNYKVFVDSGGYRKKEYWKHSFIKDGQAVPWEEAMSLFKDRTGRFGPATWQAGDYPSGRENFPVTGVSWYEAAAYAEFMDKELPTVTHWRWAAGIESAPCMIPLSNVSSMGLARAGSYPGMGPYGTYDMAGNAREWCYNRMIPGERRFILGGAWNDPDYLFNANQTAMSPFDRSVTNGFRCMKILEGDSSFTDLAKPIEYSMRNVYEEKPVSDQTFDIFLRMFSYPKTDLNESLIATYEKEGMTIEKVSFDAAYWNDRVFAYLFLPDKGSPPFQTVVFFPGNGAVGASPDMVLQPYYIRDFDFLTKSGRAVLHPVYTGTFERSHNPPRKMFEGDEYSQRDFYIMCAKDLSRSLDYLETRPDIDCSKLAYYGLSWGAERGPIMVYTGKRFRTAIFYGGGFWIWNLPFLPEINIFHYLPRLKLPVLMLNGKFDYEFPYQQSQLPYYDLLGTPDQDKKHFLDNTSHFVGRDNLIREILDWLDQYLGPVN
ncbi:protein kinase [bacterium]|nr:protein kinase [bacterium]